MGLKLPLGLILNEARDLLSAQEARKAFVELGIDTAEIDKFINQKRTQMGYLVKQRDDLLKSGNMVVEVN